MTVNSQPVVITGNTYAQFQANVKTLSPTVGGGYGWTALGTLKLLNGVYTQTFQQFFPLQQWLASPSVYGQWTKRIPRVYANPRVWV
jgi:hypothetical protein